MPMTGDASDQEVSMCAAGKFILSGFFLPISVLKISWDNFQQELILEQLQNVWLYKETKLIPSIYYAQWLCYIKTETVFE
jgi:hypothetical protein